MEFVPVIGLEVHAQLLTRTKIFCGCSTGFGAPPNHHTCPVCLGMPGVLPVLNERVVEFAVRTGLALGCQIRPVSVWSRKNYFYPDLPKGYQISQYDLPIAEHGRLVVDGDGGAKEVRIRRVHMEEDAGKLVHETGSASSLVDLNRAGVPLLEIVSEPDLASPAEASEYLKALRDLLVEVGVCSGNMEEGSFRCDANVSVMPRGAPAYGTRAEIKNLNSFRFVRQALEYEIRRQIKVVEEGARVVQETRLFDATEGRTRSMRSKEEAHDYRYFPEPDLPPLRIDPALFERVRRGLPELPRERLERFERQYGLDHEDAKLLLAGADRRLGEFFEACAAKGADPRKLANWFKGELFRALNEGQARLDSLKLTPEALAGLLSMVERGEISSNAAKEVFAGLLEGGGDPRAVARAKGLEQVSDAEAIEAAVDEVLARCPEEVARYRAGKKPLLGFLTGQAMKAMKGKGNPSLINDLIKRRLGD